MAFCYKCGGRLTAEDAFCPGCGTPVDEKAAEAAASESAPSPAPPAPPPQVVLQPVYMYPVQPVYAPAPPPAPVQKTKKHPPFYFPEKSKMLLFAALASVVVLVLANFSHVFMAIQNGADPYRQILRFTVPDILVTILFIVLCLSLAKKKAEWMLVPLVLPFMNNFVSIFVPYLSYPYTAYELRTYERFLLIYLLLVIVFAGCLLLIQAKNKTVLLLVLVGLFLVAFTIAAFVRAVVDRTPVVILSAFVSSVLKFVFVLFYYLTVTGRLRSKKALLAIYASLQAWGALATIFSILSNPHFHASDLPGGYVLSLFGYALIGAIPVILLILALKPAPKEISEGEPT